MDSVTITLTTAGSATGPFDLYSNLDGYTTAFETSVSKSSLVAGYLSTVVPTGTSTIRVKSTGACTNYIDIPVTGITTSTTTSTTTSHTTTTTSTTTSTTTATMVSLGVNGKKSSGAGGTLYMWYSTDGGTTWTILNGGTNSGVLNTTCTPLGTTASYPLGTVFTITMSDIDGPNVTIGYGTNVTSVGGTCPGVVTNCSSNTATPVAGGILTVWTTGNTAYAAC